MRRARGQHVEIGRRAPADLVEDFVRRVDRGDGRGLGADVAAAIAERQRKMRDLRLALALADHRDEQRTALERLEFEEKHRAILFDRGRRCPKLQSRRARQTVETRIIEFNAGRGARKADRAARFPHRSAHFEEIAEIGAKTEIDAKAPPAVGEVAKTYSLVEHALPEEFGAFDADRIARQHDRAIDVNVGIGEVDRQRDIVVLDNGAEQQRALSLDQEPPIRQVARVVEIEPFGRTAGGDVAIFVEHGEGVAMLQNAQRALNQRGFGFDVVLRQFDDPVHDVIHAARGFSHCASACGPRAG